MSPAIYCLDRLYCFRFVFGFGVSAKYLGLEKAEADIVERRCSRVRGQVFPFAFGKRKDLTVRRETAVYPAG